LKKLFSLKTASIKKPLKTDWASEIAAKGEKRVPDIRLAASALKDASKKNVEAGRFREERITMFESPGLKNGINLGKRSSA